MNFYVIGDESIVSAFELIGIPGRVVEAGEDVGALLDRWADKHRRSMVLLQTELAEQLSDQHLDRLARRTECLVLATPGVGDAAPQPEVFLKHVQTAIGAVT